MHKRILVVEDNLDQVELLSFNLRKEGFSIGTATDGIQAIKKAKSLLPDLILLDVMLPELDGYAVCETLRRDPKTASIPVIMVTAVSSTLASFAGREAGANDYVTKPFNFKQLLNHINALLPSSDGKGRG
jgi:DNA-binding response OmpR family regulator